MVEGSGEDGEVKAEARSTVSIVDFQVYVSKHYRVQYLMQQMRSLCSIQGRLKYLRIPSHLEETRHKVSP